MEIVQLGPSVVYLEVLGHVSPQLFHVLAWGVQFVLLGLVLVVQLGIFALLVLCLVWWILKWAQ